MNDLVRIDHKGPVAVITMSLPRKRNALSMPLIVALENAVEAVHEQPDVRAVVLQGDGGHFCAGGDLTALGGSLLQTRVNIRVGHRIIRKLIEGHLPVVAAVEGNAYGAGFSIAMACDHVVGDANTAFCAAFGRVGLMPDYGLLWTLPQRIGMAATREIVLFCETISSAAAKDLRILDRLVPEGSVRASALERAQILAKAPPGSISMTKATLARLPLPLEAMLAWEADSQSLLVGSQDFQEAARAFLEKRTPVFTGR